MFCHRAVGRTIAIMSLQNENYTVNIGGKSITAEQTCQFRIV